VVKIVRIFLIDYENVTTSGLDGIDLLSKKDKVYIFYSINTKSMDFEMIDALSKCKAKFKFFKLSKSAKNALDFQLVLFLGTRIKKYDQKAQYYIVSHDNGYQSAMDFAKENFNITVGKYNNIREAIVGEQPKLLLESTTSPDGSTNLQPKLLLESNPKNSVPTKPHPPVEDFPNLPKKEKREILESLLKSNEMLTSSLIENNFAQISALLVDGTKKTEDTLSKCIVTYIGKKKEGLVPVIFECCKDYMKYIL
jgi:hypothetical protein